MHRLYDRRQQVNTALAGRPPASSAIGEKDRLIQFPLLKVRAMILKIIGWVAVVSLVACVYFAFRKHYELTHSDQFEGTVTGYKAVKGGRNNSTTYALEIEYKDKEASSHTFVASGSSNPPARAIGAKVIVFQHLDGTKPDVLIFESTYFGLWLWLCLGIFAAGCLAGPVLLKAIYLR